MKLLLLSLLMATSVQATSREVELGTHNTVILDRDITLTTADLFVPATTAKRMFLPPEETLYILIVSPGGSAQTSYDLLNFINTLPNVAVICKYCASGAGMIFAAAKVPRLAIKKSVAIMHEMYIAKVTAKMAQDKSLFKQLIRDSDIFDKIMYDVFKISKKEYQEKITNKEWTLTGQQLVDQHMADELITIKCRPMLKMIAPDTCSE